MNFTHLHVHTEYSLLDGSSKISEIIKQAKNYGMNSLAITDHGVMYGAIDFYKEAIRNGIKPIIGCEVYVAQGEATDRQSTEENRKNYHLVLLAEDITGYENIISLVSLGFTQGFYYKPRVDLNLLKKHSKGVIALSACLAGVVARPYLLRGYESAKQMAQTYKEIFGSNNFFIELQDHGIPAQKETNKKLIQIASECDIQLVVTNDVHYTFRDDTTAHDILLCIQTGKTVTDTNRMKYEPNQFYLRSPQEMHELFYYVPSALENTQIIADRCNLNLIFNEPKLPKYNLNKDVSNFTYLKEICLQGFDEKYKKDNDNYEDLTNRLNYELNVIKNMGFIDYFLVTWDFVKYAKDNGIIVGPGRGSAAGSIVAFVLNITTVDPIKYNLIFERFLNPDRISMPDIDIDFCFERRQEVIDYCIQKYGKERVAQIITFGTMAARGAIRDVGRALNMPLNKVDTIAKLIPKELNITLERTLKISPQFKEAYDNDNDVKFLIDMAKRLEGLPRHSSTHAAGVIISDKEVSKYVPLNQSDGVITTGYAMANLEELGLLKMDFLGLRTLTVINNAVKEIERNTGQTIDIDNLDLSDSNVYKLIASGNTDGIFQLESHGMKSFMKELSPDNFEDIIAGISLFRPGPMDFIPKYILGKHGGNIQYTHPSLAPILSNTYGCIVYQEQVMEIVQKLAGYSLGRSDLMRRAMSKKKSDVMDAERQNFIFGIEGDVLGCVANGISEKIAGQIYDEMEDFAKYAFNKSHAAAYAIIGFQTAYLKCYYPSQFLAALMSSVMDNTSKITEYIGSTKKMGIGILPPCINNSLQKFSVENKSIRFGLLAIKNVGKSTITEIINERKNGPFTSLTDFVSRVKTDLNKRSMEALIKSGTFDILGGNRNQYMSIFSGLLDSSYKNKKEVLAGQLGLFDIIEEDLTKDNLPNIMDFTMSQKLAMEKEVIGIYISGHPLSQYEDSLKNNVTITSAEIEQNNDLRDGKNVVMGGMITQKTIHITKSNATMAFITVEDLLGAVEVIVFPETYKKYYHLLTENRVILVKGRLSVKEEETPKVISFYISNVDMQGELWLKIKKDSLITVDEISNICKNYKGNVPVIVYKEEEKRKYNLGTSLNVSIEDTFLKVLKELLGDDGVVMSNRASYH